jgi:glycosyltransferase involved in cell wall biosynthesis
VKIAIVSPHPVPFALGGAENLWWGLQNHINNETEHSADFVTLISPEGSFADLMGSYEAFSELDLSAYDCVISGKYPAWMVRHPNHICYMLHRLRGLYDSYAEPVGAAGAKRQEPVRRLTRWMEQVRGDDGAVDPETIAEFFGRVRDLMGQDLASETLAFPGPLARACVRFLDDAALSPQAITRYGAISRVVAGRAGYFPDGAEVAVLHPPPHRNDYHCAGSEYFFTASRLDGPKRIDLLIGAMRHVTTDIELRIAGTGPDEARLRALADGDKRIRFLGFVPEAELPGLYAGARAVPFVPADEDYGLIAIEAMRSAKPVVTVADSGGPCELITEGVSGFITAPEAGALGARLDLLARDADLAATMGEAGRQAGARIQWSGILAGLLAPPAPRPAQHPKRTKITVATTFGVYPPRNGGQARVFHLYRNLARHFDVEIVSLGVAGRARTETEIAPGLYEICVPRSLAHEEMENALSKAAGRVPVSDIAAGRLLYLTPEYELALEASALTSAALVACHPYLLDALLRTGGGPPVWYEAQDVEFSLKSTLFGDQRDTGPLLEIVRDVERRAWLGADRVFACANRDLEELTRLYGPTLARRDEVPNGVALDEIGFVGPEERAIRRTRYGLPDATVALFMGSWHGPNLDAIRQIIEAAPQVPETVFLVLGSACRAFAEETVPGNVHLLGQVEQDVRDGLLAAADVALNPMRQGSGTNLKMLDYFAAGIPVLSSAFGARGLAIAPGAHYLEIGPDGLGEALRRFSAISLADRSGMIASARTLAETEYSWAVIADRFAATLAAEGFAGDADDGLGRRG